MRALIVEQGFSRGALAAVRALATAGWTVGVASPQRHGLAASSRWCRHRHRIVPVQPVPHQFVEHVAAVVRRGGYDVVFGAGEAEVLALSAGRDVVPAAFPHAPHDVVLRAMDKAELSRTAEAAGIAVPRVLDPDALTDEHTAVVVKARLHTDPGVVGAPPRIDTTVVTGATAVRRRVAEIRAVGGDPQVQAFHEGALLAYSAVRAATPGPVVADCLQRASRIWPPGAGASCRAVTVAMDETLARRAGDLLARLDWFGLAELQFLLGADGVPRLIDLNGRFYGSLSLAVAAGANLPATWAALAVGAPAPRPVRARPGVRYQWGAGDLRRAWRERRGGLPADVAGTLAYACRATHSVAQLRDPGPALVRLGRAVTGTRAPAGG